MMVWKAMEYGTASERVKKAIVVEVNALRELRHPNIIRYVDRVLDKKNYVIYLIMEYAEGGDLAQYIAKCRKQRRYIDEDLIWRVLTQLLLALHECHSRKILHRDIKPGNVFLDTNKNIKLGDFGLARTLGKDSLFAKTTVGTPYYMSPEQVRGSAYNAKSDVWSLGCLIYEMATLQPPFLANDYNRLVVKIKEGRYRRLPSTYSDDLNKVIKAMLELSTTRRASVRSLMEFPPIALRLRERKISQQYAAVKKREATVTTQETEISAREQSILDREAAVASKERAVESLYATLKARLEAIGEHVPSLATLAALAGTDESSSSSSSAATSATAVPSSTVTLPSYSREATPEYEAFTITHTTPAASDDQNASSSAPPPSSYRISEKAALYGGNAYTSRLREQNA